MSGIGVRSVFSGEPLVWLLAALACAGCGEPAGIGFGARFGHLPQALSQPCPTGNVPGRDYLDQIDLFRVRVAWQGDSTQRDFAVDDVRSAGAIEVAQVPSGADRSVLVSGMLGQAPLWRGYHGGIAVERDKSQKVPVLMTRVAATTCARNAMAYAKVFGTATRLEDGRVLVVGGFFQVSEGEPCAQCRRYVASPTAEIYDPYRGTFTPVGQLHELRGLHQAARLGDGRVLVVGGAASMRYDPAESFPLVPESHRVTLEVFDPKTEEFTLLDGEPETPLRVFHTATTLADGRVLIAGGGARVTAQDASNKTSLCESSGDTVTCFKGPAMTYKRIGHTATLLDDGRVFMWGGVTNSGATGVLCNVVGVTQCPEWFMTTDNAFVPVDASQWVEGASRQSNLFFATATSLGSYGVLIAGGLKRMDSETELLFEDPGDDPNRSRAAFVYQPNGERIGNSVSSEAGNDFKLHTPRLLAQAIPLARDGRAAVVGGYSDLELTPTAGLDVFDIAGAGDKPGGFFQISVEGEGVSLRQSRGGLTALALPGGTALVLGGETEDVPGGRVPLQTAEIFTDIVEPSL